VAPTPLDRRRLYFEPLLSEHIPRFETFSCGVPDLDAFLKEDALRLQEAHISFTYLAWLEREGGDDAVVGYISLITDALTLEPDERCDLPAIRFAVLPALKVGRLATDKRFREETVGIGTTMMRFAFAKGLELAGIVGARFLTVDALHAPEGSVRKPVDFYTKLGFVRNAAPTYAKKKQFVSMRLDLFGSQTPSLVDSE